jgi:hypothetical protein
MMNYLNKMRIPNVLEHFGIRKGKQKAIKLSEDVG